MNPVPFLALAVVASGYVAATETTDAYFDGQPAPTLTAYSATASEDLSVYDVLAHGAQPADEPHCSSRALLTETLSQDFAEAPIETRVKGDDLQLQLWASDLMGTWTMVHHGQDGISCIVSSGTGWTERAKPDDAFDHVAFAS